MSEGEADPAQSVRRLLVVALTAALVAGAGALALSLLVKVPSVSADAATPPRLFPARFTQAGFVSHPVRYGAQAAAGANRRGLTGRLPTLRANTVWLVVRCDRGTLDLQIGPATSRVACTGALAGAVALHVTAPTLAVRASVSERQSRFWGVAVYR
jgi:hypothetical protein